MKNILVKPVITEKSNDLTEDLGKYTFVVTRDVNKIEIRKAIEDMYGVGVKSIRTMVMPAKDRSKHTAKGYAEGRTNAFKKALVTLEEGDSIDFYSNI